MADIEKTDREWQEMLSPLAYKVTRKHGTERAFSHDNFPKEPGYYACVFLYPTHGGCTNWRKH